MKAQNPELITTEPERVTGILKQDAQSCEVRCKRNLIVSKLSDWDAGI